MVKMLDYNETGIINLTDNNMPLLIMIILENGFTQTKFENGSYN
jgi:hypothetical protein